MQVPALLDEGRGLDGSSWLETIFVAGARQIARCVRNTDRVAQQVYQRQIECRHEQADFRIESHARQLAKRKTTAQLSRATAHKCVTFLKEVRKI